MALYKNVHIHFQEDKIETTTVQCTVYTFEVGFEAFFFKLYVEI